MSISLPSVYQYLKLSDDFAGLLVEKDDPVLALHEHPATRTSEEEAVNAYVWKERCEEA